MINPLITARCNITAQFYDVDPMNVVWHGHYPRFFEEARCVLLDMLDYNYSQMQSSGYLWPVVDFRIKYIRPLVLYQKFIVEAGLIEYENRLKIDYRIYDDATGEVLTKATSIQVAVNASNNEMLYECPPALTTQVKKVIR